MTAQRVSGAAGERWRDLRHIRASWGGRRMPAKDGESYERTCV